MKSRYIFIIFCLLLLVRVTHSQEVLIGLDYNPVLKSQPSQEKIKRTKAEKAPLHLPFIDDFSKKLVYPDTAFWEDNYAYVNQSYPILPPTVGVVTLDALDASGNLYAHASSIPFGADTLTSRKIRLDSTFSSSTSQKLIPADSVYFSFYYQPGGGYGKILDRTGSTPDPGDSLVLEFYRQDSMRWETVWSTGGFDLDVLYDSTGYFFDFVMIPITDTFFFTSGFQFRFRNYCSLSQESYARNSNCDQWHIDYIYLDQGRSWSKYDASIRDVAFVTPAQSVLKTYQAMPSRQFKSEELKTNLHNTIANLYNRTFNISYHYIIQDENGQTVASEEGGNANIDPFFPSFTYQTYAPHAEPPLNYTFPNVRSGKNIYTIKHVLPRDTIPQNDTVEFKQVFWNYYAYDDGSAENGYAIESTIGSPKIAYRLGLSQRDTLSALTIHFNYTLYNANNIPFKIVVWAYRNGMPGEILYEDGQYRNLGYRDSVSIGLNNPDIFILDHPVLVSDTIFFGIVQRSKGFINIGFDRNNNASEHIFYDAGSGWTNSYLKGALMMRPYFGYQLPVGIDKPKKEKLDCKIYPNPAKEYIQIDLPNDVNINNVEVSILNIMGKEVYRNPYKNRISIQQLSKGVYIIQVIDKQTLKFYTGKLIVID